MNHQTITKIASEIIAGNFKPVITSNQQTTVYLTISDFKSPEFFHNLMETLGLHDALQRTLKITNEHSDEPEVTNDDYEDIQLKVVRSIMQ